MTKHMTLYELINQAKEELLVPPRAASEDALYRHRFNPYRCSLYNF